MILWVLHVQMSNMMNFNNCILCKYNLRDNLYMYFVSRVTSQIKDIFHKWEYISIYRTIIPDQTSSVAFFIKHLRGSSLIHDTPLATNRVLIASSHRLFSFIAKIWWVIFLVFFLFPFFLHRSIIASLKLHQTKRSTLINVHGVTDTECHQIHVLKSNADREIRT